MKELEPRNSRILIIDDDPGARESYREILSPSPLENILAVGAYLFNGPQPSKAACPAERFELTIVTRGEEGVEEVAKSVEKNTPFTTAFVDIKLPGMDGTAAARLIWTLDPRVKIVIVTAFSEYSPADIIQEVGADDIFYLRKPFHSEEIRQFACALTKQWNLEQERERLAGELEKANLELEDMNRSLQRKVEEQTAMLLQSEKMASIGLLAAGVAHEINNPISFVKSNLTTLLRYSQDINEYSRMMGEIKRQLHDGEPHQIQMLLEAVRQLEERKKIPSMLQDMTDLAQDSLEGVNRVSKIVNDLRTFSREDSGELKYANINEILDTTLNIIWNQLKYKATVLRDYGRIPDIQCWPDKISQALMNLLVNAAQAIAEKGTIRIETRFRPEKPGSPNGRLEIKIIDSGAGIPKEHLTKIFDPFFTTKPVGQGTGLGLSITYDIIRAHGGKIYVESEVGVGTTFLLSLPLEPPP